MSFIKFLRLIPFANFQDFSWFNKRVYWYDSELKWWENLRGYFGGYYLGSQSQLKMPFIWIYRSFTWWNCSRNNFNSFPDNLERTTWKFTNNWYIFQCFATSITLGEHSFARIGLSQWTCFMQAFSFHWLCQKKGICCKFLSKTLLSLQKLKGVTLFNSYACQKLLQNHL